MFSPHQCRKCIDSTHVAGDLETVCIHANKTPLGPYEHLMCTGEYERTKKLG